MSSTYRIVSARTLVLLGLVGLMVSLGCKKDEPEASEDEEPTAGESTKAEPKKVAEGKTGTKKGALEAEDEEDDDDDPPVDRKVKKRVVDGKKPAGKAGDKAEDGDEKPARSAKSERVRPSPRKVGEPPHRRAGKGNPGPPGRVGRDKPKVRPGRAANGPRRLRPGAGGPGDDERGGEGEPDAEDDEDGEPPLTARQRARKARRDRNRKTRQRVGAPVGPRDPPTAGPRVGSGRPAGRAEPPSARHRATPPTGRARPNAERLLLKEELVKTLSITFAVDVHELAGLPSDETYDGIYWGNTSGATYIAGIQLWVPRSALEANRRYTQMIRSYPNAEETTAITNKTFLAYWNDFIYLGFLDATKQTVVSLTCHRKMCDTPQKLVELALKVKERL